MSSTLNTSKKRQTGKREGYKINRNSSKQPYRIKRKIPVDVQIVESVPKTPDDRLIDVLEDPLKFVAACWPHIKLYDKQKEILLSVRDNVETLVHAANEMGKDFISAIAVIWWFTSRMPAKVITTSSGETQLKSILWGEIRQRIRDSVIPLPFDIHYLNIRRLLPDGTTDPLSEILGHVTTTPENFQGHHLDHDIPRVLIVFDEASGIDDVFYDAADSWAHHKLIIGNPLNTTNFFYRFAKKGDRPRVDGGHGLFRKVIRISGEDSPNVIYGRMLKARGIPGPYPAIIPGVLSYQEFVQKEAEWDKIKKHTRLYGMFYEGEEALLYPPDWLDLAEKQHDALEADFAKRKEPRRALAMAIDGAEGRDMTVWTIVDEYGIIAQIARPTPDTSQIANFTIAYMKDFGLDARNVFFDLGGGGRQASDFLKQRGYMVKTVFFGNSANPEKPARMRSGKIMAREKTSAFKNRRAEMYAMLRDALNPSTNGKEGVFGIPRSLTALREELAIMPLYYDEEGKLYLPPKDRKPTQKESTNLQIPTIKQMLGRSPDRADSLVMAIFALKNRNNIQIGRF